MVDPTPVDGGGPVITPADQAGRTKLLALGAVGLVAAAGFAFWIMPARETGESQRDRAAAQKEARDRPGDPGLPLRKPGYQDVPQAVIHPVPTEKPGNPVVLQAVRRRPRPSDAVTWTAKPPPEPPVASAPPATATPAAAKDDRPTKLAGLAVMQAERIDDASWYLMPGEMVMCRNNQPLTERTGAMWTATIPEDKLSADGTRRLIPANSQAFGKIVSGFNRGDRRLAGVITHIMTPSVPGKPTLIIPIDMGQVGDDIGRVDMDGNIESDFWGRLGTVGAYAVLDALARGGTSYAAGSLNRALNGNSDGVNVNVGNFGGVSGQSLAGMQMQEELRKQPQFNRPEAQACSILITKPVDFRKALQIGG